MMIFGFTTRGYWWSLFYDFDQFGHAETGSGAKKWVVLEEEDLFIHLMLINNTLAKTTIFTDGGDKQRVTVNFFSVGPGGRSRTHEANFTQLM